MSRPWFMPLIGGSILSALLLAMPCIAKPVLDPDLQRLSGQLTQLESDPSLGQFGDADRFKAHQALDVLAQTLLRSKEHAHALYIAERRVAAAQFAAEADLAERQLEQLDREHDRILLEASRRDADQARHEAERLRLQNTAREEEAQRADAERQAQAQQEAGMASDESDQARALAEARAQEAALAQQEAALSTGATTTTATAVREPRGPSMTLSGAVFVQGKSILRNDPSSRARIKVLVAFVQAKMSANGGSATIRVESHTDNQGSAQTNLSLSQQRAEAVRNVLRADGVPAGQIQAVGLGGEQPVASNATAQGRERNRRVKVIVIRGTN
jgi:outer membrane protein OmpA-like peptidoglycan-associated protein